MIHIVCTALTPVICGQKMKAKGQLAVRREQVVSM